MAFGPQHLTELTLAILDKYFPAILQLSVLSQRKVFWLRFGREGLLLRVEIQLVMPSILCFILTTSANVMLGSKLLRFAFMRKCIHLLIKRNTL